MKTGEGPGGRGAASSSCSHWPPILLVIGPERWLKAQAIQRVKETCVAPGFEEMDWVRFSEPPEDPCLILEAAMTAPFGSPLRGVVVEGIPQIDSEGLSWLTKYRRNPNPRTCLVLCAERLDRASDVGSLPIVWCQPLKGGPLKEWLHERCRAAGKSIEPEAADRLITRVGSDLSSLALAVEGLSLFVAQAGKITVKEVEALIAPSVRERSFDILDTAAAGHPEAAIAILHQALEQGRLTVEQWMGALGWYYRMAWKARNGSAHGMGSGTTSPRRQAALTRLSRWPLVKLQAALEDLLQADAGLKLGNPAPELLADQLLLRLAS